MAHRNQIAPRADGDRRIPRRRLARKARIRQMVREIRRLFHAGGDARADSLRRRTQYQDHSRNRPPGPQPQHRLGASRNPLQLPARHGVDQRIRLPFGVVRGPRSELRAVGGHPGRVVRAVPLGVYPCRRRRGRNDPMDALSRLSGADGVSRDGRSASVARPFHGADGRNTRGSRQTARGVERSGTHGGFHQGVPCARLGERESLSGRHGKGLPDGGDAGRIFLFRHAPDAPRKRARLGGNF